MMEPMNNAMEGFNFTDFAQQSFTEAASCFLINANINNEYATLINQLNEEDSFNCIERPDGSVEEFKNYDLPNPTMVLGNPQNIKDNTEYELIIYKQMLESESILPVPTVVQTEITPQDRGILVDWLCRVHCKCRLNTAIFYRCIGIIDRLFLVSLIRPENLKLIGCAAMLIASKIEGQTFYICHAIELSENSFTREMIINAETEINNLLGFQLNFPTSFTFLSHLQRLSEETSEIVLLSRYIIEVCASAIEFINVRPSAIASTAILMTRILLKSNEEAWTKQMEDYTGYSYNDLIGYAKIVHSILLDENREETVFIRRKYGSLAFHCVANLSLPCFIV